MKFIPLLISIALAFSGCSSSHPPEANIQLTSLVFDKFDNNNISTLKRYFIGNSRWEIRKVLDKTYAIRKEKRNGKYLSTRYGYYNNNKDSAGIYQSRVIISFGQYYGYGDKEWYITITDSKDKNLQMTIEDKHYGAPGISSYLIIENNTFNVEIYEQAKDIKRTFTSKAIKALNTELSAVLKYQEEIDETGILPLSDYYPATYDSTFFNILDGLQPGIYMIQAGVAPDKDGVVYTKAFNTKNNKELSADTITRKTTREIGWSNDGSSIFLYETQLTVYEGDWDHQYEARFEIWLRDVKGNEKKLAEKTRLINGWGQ